MIPKNYQTLIEKLILGTSLKRITWNRTSRPSEYQVNIGSGAITTDYWEDEQAGRLLVDFSIWNDQGEVIDTLSASEGEEDYVLIRKLYECAKRSYLKIDDTITDMMNHLNF